MSNKNRPQNDPRHHAAKIQEMLRDTANHMREDVHKVDAPRAQALFETSAEVIESLMTAYAHYEERSEKAWPG